VRWETSLVESWNKGEKEEQEEQEVEGKQNEEV